MNKISNILQGTNSMLNVAEKNMSNISSKPVYQVSEDWSFWINFPVNNFQQCLD